MDAGECPTRAHLRTVSLLPPLDGTLGAGGVKRHRLDADGENAGRNASGLVPITAPTAVKRLLNAFISMALPGFGGAGLTGVKLQGGGDKITTLIVNAAE